MAMVATSDFTAHVNGVDYALRKGEAFEGSDRAAELLKRQGLLQAKRERKQDNER